MKISLAAGLSVLAISSFLVGCQSSESTEGTTEKKESTSESETHEHGHSHDEETKQIHEDFFEDAEVGDRSLLDWEGDWQSVYPYLQDGTLDEVFTYKAEQEDAMTFKEYKEYYDKGYQTDVERITIQDDYVTFFKNGKENSGEYIYDGYEILTYEAGNKGVRYIFKLAEDKENLPQFIQFSDHGIKQSESDHYHLYWGEDRKSLLDEVANWPTYYPSEMDGHEIAHEMIEH